MRRVLGILVAIGVFAGCSQKTWYHDTKGPADFDRELQICKTEAMQTHYGYNLFIVRDLTEECLEDRYGWTELEG